MRGAALRDVGCGDVLRKLPAFAVAPPAYLTDEVVAFVRAKTRLAQQSFGEKSTA